MQNISSTDVGLLADLDLVYGRFGDYILRRCYARCTIVRFQWQLRDLAQWLCRRRQRLSDVTLEDMSPILSYFSRGRSSSFKEENRAALHAWLRFKGRYKPALIPAPWQSWVDEYIHFLEAHKGHEVATLDTRRRIVSAYMAWQFGSRKADWSRLRPPDIIDYAQVLAKRELSRLTIKGRLSALRQFLRFLELRGVCGHTLVQAVPAVSARGRPSARTEVLSNQQRQQLLTAFVRSDPAGCRNYAITICMVDLGLRISEVIALRLNSIDWERRQLAVPPVKNGRGRTLPLARHVYDALRSYFDRGRPDSASDQFFLSHPVRSGSPLTVGAARQHILRAFKRCGFPSSWGGVHRLRHTFASRLHANGIDLKQISDLLGHRGIETTNLYTQVDVTDLRALVQPWPLVS